MIKKLLAICVAAFPALVTAQDNNVCSPIYEDYLVGCWSDWSGAPRNMAATDVVKTFDKSIRVDMRPWDFIWLNHDRGGIPTHKFAFLTFWIHGGTAGNQNLSVYARVASQDMPPVRLANYTVPRANSWRLVRIPLADLGAANVDKLNGVVIRDLVGSGMPTFYLDSMKLAPLPSVTRLPRVSVDFNREFQTVSKSHLGINTAFWDWEFDTPETQARVSEAGFKFFRYPGGMASEYDWRTNRSTKTGELAGTSTLQFVRNATQVGADMLITANYGSATPTDAAEWVRYTNIHLGTYVKYWTIGNEPYGEWEYDMQPVRHDAIHYAEFTKDAMTQMKAFDPTIKVGIAGTLNETDFAQSDSVVNPRTGETVNGWMPVLLQELKEINAKPDFVEIHYYAYGDWRESDSYLLQVGDEMGAIMATVRQMLLDHWGPDGNTIEVMLTEINNVWHSPGKQATSIVNALFLADMFGRSVREGLSGFAWFDLHHSATPQFNNSRTLHGWRNFGDVGVLSAGQPSDVAPPLNTPYPTFYAFKLLKLFAEPGDKLIECTSTSPLIGSYAVKTASGKVRLMLINKSAMTAASVPVSFSGYSPSNSRRSWRYGALEDLRGLDVVTRSFSTSRNVFSLPPYSITIFEL